MDSQSFPNRNAHSLFNHNLLFNHRFLFNPKSLFNRSSLFNRKSSIVNRKSPLLLLLLLLPIIAQAQESIRTLHPYPKAAFERAGGFSIGMNTSIVIPDSPDSTTVRAARYLRRILRERGVGTLTIIPASAYNGARYAILLGDSASYPALSTAIAAAMPRGEMMPGPGGYVLDISPDFILIAGSDSNGVFNGVATLAQFTRVVSATMYILGVHIWDYPDYPLRWVFSQHNLRGTDAITNLKNIQDTMAFYKLNGLQQNDFKYSIIASQPENYFDSVRAFKENAAARHTEIIPGVAPIGWSSGLLWHDPNLAEGFPAFASYRIEGDTGRIIPDPRVTLPNGSFESVGTNGKFTGWSFYDEGSITPDRNIYRSGSTSAQSSDFTNGNTAGNSRVHRRVTCQPYRFYHMSAWVRTENLDCDEVRLLAIGEDDNNRSRVLTFTALNVPATTSGWTKVEVSFNTLEFNNLLLYAGVWGGRSGTIWWDDFTIEDGGLATILRREGTPLHIRNEEDGREYVEGIDFEPVIDSVMLRRNGEYGPRSAPPTLRRRPGGAMSNGDTVTVSYFHPVTTVSDVNGNGSVMVCVSEDTLYTLLTDQIRRVDTLYSPKRFFLGHDEIRSMNRDSSCLHRDLSPAELLADNLTRCIDIVEDVHPGAETFVWSDMFDSLHNARDDYYLINGDLTGVWNLIPRTPVIVNWNSGNRDASLRFFAERGFRQITSPYYDAGNTNNMRAWRLSMANVPGLLGMMYTTWNGDYSFLRPFSYYAWGAGPYIIHTPLDTMVLPSAVGTTGPVRFAAEVQADPYDPADRIVAATAVLIPSTGDEIPGTGIPFPLADSAGLFTATYPDMPWRGFRYKIVATNSQGLVRETPWYDVRRIGFASAPSEEKEARIAASIAPNPAASTTTIRFAMPHSGAWQIRIIDLLGATVLRFDGEGPGGEATLDLSALPSGTYRCEIHTPEGTGVETLQVAR